MRNKSTGLVPRTLLLLFFFFSAAAVNDRITAARPLRQGQTIVSADEVFQLGFFTPGDDDGAANNTYLGIWYRNIPYPQAVWVANRDSPVKGSNAVLKIAGDGNIVISDGQSENAVWSSNHSSKGIANPVVQLLDSGNLVIRDADSSSSLFLWQSFEHPTDTLLPGMKLGRDLRTGVDWFIRSWKSPTEPGSGSYSFKMNTAGDPEFFLSQDDTQTIYRSGPWDGVGFSGVPEMKPTQFINFTFEVTPEVVYYSFNLLQHPAVLSRLVVNSSGSLQRFTWIEDKKQWAVFWYAPKDQCDNYRECGAYGLCDTNASPVCECLRGFRPRNPQAWNLRDGSSGCVRVTQLACRADRFWPLKGVKLPDTSLAMLDKAMNLQQCEAACRVNCSCTAYANAYVAPGGGTGCVIWTGELADIRQYADGAGQVVYVRLAASDIGTLVSPLINFMILFCALCILRVLCGVVVCFGTSPVSEPVEFRGEWA